jgi:hypothetical protein
MRERMFHRLKIITKTKISLIKMGGFSRIGRSSRANSKRKRKEWVEIELNKNG